MEEKKPKLKRILDYSSSLTRWKSVTNLARRLSGRVCEAPRVIYKHPPAKKWNLSFLSRTRCSFCNGECFFPLLSPSTFTSLDPHSPPSPWDKKKEVWLDRKIEIKIWEASFCQGKREGGGGVKEKEEIPFSSFLSPHIHKYICLPPLLFKHREEKEDLFVQRRRGRRNINRRRQIYCPNIFCVVVTLYAIFCLHL